MKDKAKEVAFNVQLTGDGIIARDRYIILGNRGSIAHGMYVPPENEFSTDDEDLIGVVVMPKEYYIGLKKFETKESQYKDDTDYDIVVYDIKHYFSLLLRQNPNVISLLWLKPEHYLHVTDQGKLLIKNRDIFSSKKGFYSFIGYANSQMKRMIKGDYNGRMGAKRKALFDRFGFCPKNASHLIRLLRMLNEFLLSGEMVVFRPDAEELIEIKTGKWSKERIESEANRLFAQANTALMLSNLPENPDYDSANNLLIRIISEIIMDKNNE